MTNVAEIFKALRVPTPGEMKDFAKGFSLEQWARLCKHKEFNALLLTDLSEAKKFAAKLMGD